jgi:hypothetical protein
LPLGRQIGYAIGQFGWSTLINVVGLALVYFTRYDERKVLRELADAEEPA